MKNPASHHFSATCAQRLTADRLDFEGSLLEISELNRHHAAFSDGMKACQEIIGLVRGLKTGLANFTESVNDMMATESRYPLPKLSIDVPARSVEYARHFDELVAAAKQERGLHPKAFSERIRASIQDVYQEPQIEAFFETMGEELSSCANSQW
jgi:hypothetical protein